MRRILAFILFFCSISIAVGAQQLPNLFLVGDSISIYYTPALKDDLAGMANLSRKMSVQPETIPVQLGDPNVQGGDSRMVLQYLQSRYQNSGFKPETVLINCGLHDIKRDQKTGKVAVDAKEYESNLNAIERLIGSHGGKMLWISTTPVDDARHNSLSTAFFRYNADVIHYNTIAATVCAKLHVPIIDLYTFTAHFGNGHYIDHVHYDEATRALQAAYIAGFVQSWLEEHSEAYKQRSPLIVEN
ncbi:MAG: SGNH/GDSL hydrolase family protein [Anaerolineaceae bacterium]|nr:SGNH/GDSL hydrolase family protein [Anaerolineaceae bacterium]